MTYNNLTGGRSKKSLKKRGARKSRRKGSKKLRKSKKAGDLLGSKDGIIRKRGREIINFFKDGYTGNTNSKFISFDMEQKLIDINNHLSAIYCGKRNGKFYYTNIDRIGNTTSMMRTFRGSTYNEGKDTVINIMAEVNRLLAVNMPDILHSSKMGKPRELEHILHFNSKNINNVVADDINCRNYYSNDGTENKPTFNPFTLPRTDTKSHLFLGDNDDNPTYGSLSERSSSTGSNNTAGSNDVNNRETEVRFNYDPNVSGGSRRRKSKKSKRTKKSRRSRRRH